MIALATASLSVAVVTRLTATAEYEYKPGEYLVAKDGLSPNKQFAIVCGDNKFGVHLMDAKTKEPLGELEKWRRDSIRRLRLIACTGLPIQNTSGFVRVSNGIMRIT